MQLSATSLTDGRRLKRPNKVSVAVIHGGLVTSTACEFLIRPGLFWAWRDAAKPLLMNPAR